MSEKADIWESSPVRLARLLAAPSSLDGTWQTCELRVVLLKQLAAPAEFIQAESGHELSPGNIWTVQQLFELPAPPLELLKITKDFAKAQGMHPESTLCREVAATLYYVSIGVALVRHGIKITQLSNAELRLGLEWCLAQPWMAPQLTPILYESLSRVGE